MDTIVFFSSFISENFNFIYGKNNIKININIPLTIYKHFNNLMENRSIVENDISEMEKMIEEGKMKEMLDMFVKLKKKGMSLHLNQMKSQYKKAMNIKAPQMVNSNSFNRLNSAIKNPFDQPNTQQSNVIISFNFV